MRSAVFSSHRTVYAVGLAALAVLLLAATQSAAKGPGHYTGTQAAAGATVYSATCQQCHGVNLQGQSGPGLVGAAFRKYVGTSGTAATLEDFIARQMPADKPGSLTQQQYLDVTAFLLARNGYPPGNVPLTKSTLAEVALVGGTGATAPKGASTNEIVRAAAPKNHVYAKVTAGANVAVSDAMMTGAASDRANWVLTGRTYDNQRYSPLTQVDASNVTSLHLVGIAQTGMTASFETTPIVVNGVMYITTPTVDNKMKIMALDATNGRRIWDTTYNLGAFQICCGPVNRGPAVGYGMVYALTLDDKLLALDAKTGALRWQSTVADPSVGYSETMTPQVYDGMVIVGSAGGEWPIRGFVAAYDAKNGKQRWRWDSTDPKTYAGASGKRGGGRYLLHRQSQSRSERHLPQRRQPLERLDRRARRAHRQAQMGLPRDQARRVGLRRRQQRRAVRRARERADDTGRRGSGKSRLVLHPRPPQRQADSQVGPVRADDAEHVQPADTQRPRDAPRSERRRGMVATGVLAGNTLRVRARHGPAHAVHDESRSVPEGPHSARQRVQQHRAARHSRRALRRDRHGDRKARVDVHDARTAHRRRARDGRQPRVLRRGQRLVRRARCESRKAAVALQPRRGRERAAGHLRGERPAVRRGRGGRQLPAVVPVRRHGGDLQAERYAAESQVARMGVVDDVGERLVRFRVQAGLEPEPAAAKARVDVERLAGAEAGEVALTDAEIDRLARAYGVDPTEIFGGRVTPIRDIAAG